MRIPTPPRRACSSNIDTNQARAGRGLAGLARQHRMTSHGLGASVNLGDRQLGFS
jgi:hypothetical protein